MPVAYKVLSFVYHVVRFFHRKVGVVYVYFECKLKAKRFQKNLQGGKLDKLDAGAINRYKAKWKKISRFVSPIYVDNVSRIFGEVYEDVVPSNIYYTHIEPRLNNISFALIMEDKSQLDWVYGDIVPQIFVRNIHGIFFVNKKAVQGFNDEQLAKQLQGQSKIVVKQSVESHGGRSVQVFSFKDDGFYNSENELLDFDYLEKNYRLNFVIQEYLYQHDYFAQFNSSSLNTLRVMTYRSVLDNEIHILNTTMRVGAPGSFVDNRKAGGYAVGVTQNGRLRDFGVDNRGNLIREFGSDNTMIKDVDTVVNIEKVWKTAIQLATLNHHARVLGFDMTVDQDEKVRLIEVNTSDLGIDNVQQSNGALFHRFTDEIIDFCSN